MRSIELALMVNMANMLDKPALEENFLDNSPEFVTYHCPRCGDEFSTDDPEDICAICYYPTIILGNSPATLAQNEANNDHDDGLEDAQSKIGE